jgi:imidazolonepropionase-like amidohydrolase
LSGVTLVRADGSRQANVTLVVRGEFLEGIGTDVVVPADAQILEGDSLEVYPGIVDAQGGAEIEFPELEVDRRELEPWDPPRVAQGFTPHRRAVDYLSATGEGLKSARTSGVVAGAALPDGPVMPGRAAALVYRQAADTPQDLVAHADVGPVFTLRGARGAYPGTLFGVIAFIRQSFENARHDGLVRTAHARDPRGVRAPAWDPDYEVLRAVLAKQVPVFFAADGAEDIRQVLGLADEYEFDPVIVGGDEAWRVADLLQQRDVPVLVSLDFPEPKRWKPEAREKPDSAEAAQEEVPDAAVERERERLENLYANAGRLAAAGVRFALTSGGGEADIREGVQKAIEYGLTENRALAATTTTPSALLDIEYVTQVDVGMPATFVVTNGPLFEEDTDVLYTFVEGALERGKAATAADSSGEEPTIDLSGTWKIDIDAEGDALAGSMTLKQVGAEFSGSLTLDMGVARIRDGLVDGDKVTFELAIDAGGESMTFKVKGTASGDSASGSGRGPMGSFTWKATRTGTPEGVFE